MDVFIKTNIILIKATVLFKTFRHWPEFFI